MYKDKSEIKTIAINFEDHCFEISGSMSDEVVAAAKRLQESILSEGSTIQRALNVMFALRVMEEVCTNSSNSMSDEQLKVAMEFMAR